MKSNPIWAIIAGILLGAGMIAWAWTGDWRWAVTGIGGLFAIAAIGSAMEKYEKGKNK